MLNSMVRQVLNYLVQNYTSLLNCSAKIETHVECGLYFTDFHGTRLRLLPSFATFVQGTIVQGDLCQRGISARTLLSKETLVPEDFCQRCRFETVVAVHIAKFSPVGQSQYNPT